MLEFIFHKVVLTLRDIIGNAYNNKCQQDNPSSNEEQDFVIIGDGTDQSV